MELRQTLVDTKLFTVKEIEQLKSLDVLSAYDLMTYFPYKYAEEAQYVLIESAQKKQTVMLIGIASHIESSQDKYGYKKVGIPYTRLKLSDGTGIVEVVFWNMPYLAKQIKDGDKICVSGILNIEGNKKTLSSPKLIKDKKLTQNILAKTELHNSLFENKEKPLTPVYKENKQIKTATIKHCLQKIFTQNTFVSQQGYLPEYIEKDLSLPSFKNALLMRHFPKNQKDADIAKKYFSFQEIFLIQIYREREKFLKKDTLAYQIKNTEKTNSQHLKLLPFTLTNGQSKVMEAIRKDLEAKHPMSRLVEGDVGSGKTALAMLSALKCIDTTIKVGNLEKRLQAAIMAPTEVLASQHFETFCKLLNKYCLENNLHIGLLAKNTGKLFPSKINNAEPATFPKNKIKKYLEEGKIDILIGTHSLIQKSVKFSRLGLLVIDEQHRFGIKQRMNLIERAHSKNLEEVSEVKIPHLLSLSATPIPRTLALTIYGDLDLSILDELPPGRKRAKTRLCLPSQRDNMYSDLEDYLNQGKQAYIICSKVEESEEEGILEDVTRRIKNVKDEYTDIQKKYPKYKVGLLYGSQPKLEKEKVLQEFYNNQIQILVSTSVVEVGVSVPNATFMLIENSDRFGLSQLHQLRGRAERSSDESLCFLGIDKEDGEVSERLEALTKTSNGFELAEIDLAERGAGSLLGKRQSGLTDVGMEAIKNRKLVEIAKACAEKLIQQDSDLKNFPQLSDFLNSLEYHGE